MSGGLYGRGKAPERACLKPKDWPADERLVWEKACEPADTLTLDIGARAYHAPISNFKAQQGYGRWLTFLHFEDKDALALAAADRITPKRVIAYVECLHLRAVISTIEIDDHKVRIIGHKATLADVIAGRPAQTGNIRGFVRKWRALGDSNPCFRRERVKT